MQIIWQLVRDTFRQAGASGISWMMLGITGCFIILCLSVRVADDVTLHSDDEVALFLPAALPQAVAPSVVLVLGSSGPLQGLVLTTASQRVWSSPYANPEVARVEGIQTIGGRMSIAFGAVSVPVARERRESVRFFELLLAGGSAGTLGLLLILVWTAGFVPTFLKPAMASALLAKPVERWRLLLGKCFGVLVFVGVQVVIFVFTTWFALGISTHVWDTTYWWCVPLLLVQFITFYSFSILLAVTTRSTVACVFGSMLFWLLGWGINFGTVMARATPEPGYLPSVTHTLAQAAYWVSPKPVDSGYMLFKALDAQQHFEKPAVFGILESERGFSPYLSILSSLIIAAAFLALSAYEFKVMDY